MDFTAVGFAAGSLLGACLAASMTKALREFSISELESLAEAYELEGRAADILGHPPAKMLAFEALQHTFVAAYAVSVATLLLPYPTLTFVDWGLVGGAWALSLLALWGAVSWIPWIWVDLGCERYLLLAWPWWGRAARLVSPFVAIAERLAALAHRSLGSRTEPAGEQDLADEIRTVVAESVRDGLVASHAREMIEGVIELADAVAAEIMTPRPDLVCMSKDVTFDEALEFVGGTRHTRIPVYDGSRDRIVGILHARDLLTAAADVHLGKSPAPDLATILREPQFVPETIPVNKLLHEFRKNRTRLAIVLDEFGGVAGVVTIEDVLEEIVGEIVDEHGDDVGEYVAGIRRIDERTAEVFGKTHVEEVQDRLGILLPEDREFDTIGGFVFNELGRVPQVGAAVTYRNVKFTVLDMHGRRVHRVRIEILDAQPSEPVTETEG